MSISMDPTALDTREKAAIVPIEFWTDYENDQTKPGTVKPVDWVKWAKKGSNNSETSDKISRVEKHNPKIWEVVQAYYMAWKKGQEIPTDGTPLAAWPGISRYQADRLKLMNIRTVEDVAGMTDADKDRFGMGGLDLIVQARSFVKSKSERSVIQSELASRDKRIDELEASLAEALAIIKADPNAPQIVKAKRPYTRKPKADAPSLAA